MADSNILFVRSEDEENNDPWDDTLLIKAYESAFEKVKGDLSKKGKVTASTSGPQTGSKLKKWNVGHYCRAKFSEDGLIYEARIIKIDGNQCTIKYYGYDNEEDKLLSELMKSKGSLARKKQIEISHKDNMEWEENTASSQQSSTILRGAKIKDCPQESFHNLITEDIPHPPPPPPLLFDTRDKAPDSREALHAMLMSWYMSGYHTGYYEGLKRSEQRK